MTVLVDTDVLVAFLSAREARHDRARSLVDRVLRGEWGAPFVTDYVLDEALTLLLARGSSLQAADQLLALTLEPVAPEWPARVPLLRLNDAAFRGAIPLFRRHFRRGLSFTDCTSVSVMADRGIDVIVSFDRGFDGLVARIEA